MADCKEKKTVIALAENVRLMLNQFFRLRSLPFAYNVPQTEEDY